MGARYQGHLVLPATAEICSVGRRIGSYFLEIFLYFVTLGIGWLIWSLVVWGKGQTPAKQLLGMYCYHPRSQQRASWGRMLMRSLAKLIYIVPFLGLVSAIITIINEEHRAIHDSMVETVVVQELAQFR